MGFVCPFVGCGLIFSAFCPLRAEYRTIVYQISIFAGCGLLFGLYRGIYAPAPSPYIETRKSGLPQNFVYIFFIIKFFIKFFYFYNI